MNCKEMLRRECIVKEICSELNNFTDLRSTMNFVLSRLKELTHCDAIGIRLEDKCDYPYYVFDGFSKDFLVKENSLCISGSESENPLFDCLCGKIISGSFDTKLKFFTKSGSFWTNSISSDLKSISNMDCSGKIRGTCATEGYQSMALIPIRAKGIIIGLIQLNNKNAHSLSLEIVELIEKIGENIGLAILNSRSYSKMLEVCKLKDIISQQKEKLSKAIEIEKMRTDFFANISHEMRTPINIILNSNKLLLKYHEENQITDETGKAKKLFNMVNQNCYRMTKLVNNLIDISRIDAGFLQLNPQKCDIEKLLSEISNSISEYIIDHGVEISFLSELSKSQKDCIVDREKIERVLLNLLSNAIKFSNKGGRITIHICKKGKFVQISVEDTGIGIPEEMLPKIFDRFIQIEDTLIRKYEGTGLGLSIVKALIEMHSGNISVISTLGLGSKFTILLPYNIRVKRDKQSNVISPESREIVESIKIEFSDFFKSN